jgi:peptidoglycan/xylan/chitin deacetylase (PgdA/CDA1 family)
MNVPALLYHKIDYPTPDVKIRGAYTSPSRFERQMSYLLRQGYSFATAGELVRCYGDYGKFPDKCICVTFDDGWKDNYLHAAPIVKKLGIKATIFLVPSCIGNVTDAVTAEGEGPREHLSRTDILEMSERGFEFGSHSMNHRLFNSISPEEIKNEVTESKNYIEDLLQKSCDTLAYPAGFFTPEAKLLVKDAGYSGAFSTVYGASETPDIFALNREEVLRRDRMPFRFGKKVKWLTG